jgi:hypothetical protein
MATNKKSFLLYCDIIHTIEKLSDEQAGKLLKHILRYVNDQDPIAEDVLTEIAFEPIKQNLKRDLVKYEEIKEKRSEAGKTGANKRWQNIANDSKRINDIAKIAVNDNDIVISKDIYRSFAHLSMSKDELHKLLTTYSQEDVDDILDAIENYKDNKKFKSLYLTAKKWLSKNEPKQPSKINYEDLDPLVKKAIELGYEKDPRKC